MKINAYAALNRQASLQPWTYEPPPLKPHEVLLRVKACGLCHSDVHMIDNDWASSSYPLVPGHEVVAEVIERGAGVTHLKTGARVGVGWQRSSCLHCQDCLEGNEILCPENTSVIGHGYGGFADYLVMDSRFCFPLPEDLPTEYAGPLMCGGITVYAGLRYAGMGSGQHIGILGVGGLGHLAVQYASRLGNTVTVFTTSPDKAEEAARLGAHDAILVRDQTLSKTPRPLDILLSTAPATINCELYLNLLASNGVLCFVGVTTEPLTVPLFPLLLKRRRLMANPIGGRAITQEMLEVSARFGVRPTIEKFAMRDANAAIEKVRRNTIRYRAVLLP